MPPKMKKGCSVVLSLCLLAAMVSGMAVQASAAEITELPSGVLIGDSDGIQVDSHGDYYIDVRNLKPGDIISKTITIQNLDQESSSAEAKIPYTVTMMAQKISAEGPLDLFDEVHLTLELEGKVVYEGSCRGDGTPEMIDTPLDLGTYAIGDRKTLEVTLEVSHSMEMHEEISKADFKWTFYAFRMMEEEPPKTGVLEDYKFLIPIGGVLLLFIIMVPLKKKRDKQAAQKAETV